MLPSTLLHARRPPINLRLLCPARRTFLTTARRDVQIHNADAETFKKAIAKENSQGKVVLVDFYADWCGPCKMLSPVLEKLTRDSDTLKTGSGRALDLVTIDTDTQTDLAQSYNVRSLPTVVAFKDGAIAGQFIGALNEAGVRKFVAGL
ncbi:thioredoxin-like protein [Rickenella mellea]|uniref:Thioredoxin-like protein n=1 Tax=Rickenella mellea TaxID=50990 RepID=A0A4Y7QBI5_9AGAM|nr:thioredoxin-like protein [Rickenella mellea]